jgi:predicted transcriptional regulator of viral defense system
MNPRLEAMAARQHGVFSYHQALKAGLSRSAISRGCVSGKWERILPGVYRLAGAPATWLQRVWAGHVWAGQGSFVSFRAAAKYFQFPGASGEIVDITTVRRLKSVSGIEVHCVPEMPSIDTIKVDGLWLTTPTRTLFDLAAVGRATCWRPQPTTP